MLRSNRLSRMTLALALVLGTSRVALGQFTMNDVGVATCGGTFTDSGGPNGGYSENEDFVKTFFPGEPGTWLRFDFMSFNVESSWYCIDRLSIHDGPDATSPLIGTYCNLRGAPGRVTSSHPTGAITFQFQSAVFSNFSGWEAAITCVSGPKNPTEFCHGNGGDLLSCTACPCEPSILISEFETGGCRNTSGRRAHLATAGSVSLAGADLRFEASGLPPLVNAILISGDAFAPQSPNNPCFGLATGLTSSSLDGLRCVVQGVLRHGVRASDAMGMVGASTAAWGAPDPVANFAGFMSGERRHFQIVYRDNPAQPCLNTGLNTTQAVSVLFAP